MNYLKVYCNLIRKAENRTPPEGYTEKHHTFPKSIFGKNNRIVVLTAREHYIAHALLEKICIQRYGLKDWRTIKMNFAHISMKSNDIRYFNSYLYESAKLRRSEFMKCQKYGLGLKHTKEARKKMSKMRKGMKWWNNGIVDVRSLECPGEQWKNGRLKVKIGLKHSEETKEKIRKKSIGRKPKNVLSGENHPFYGKNRKNHSELMKNNFNYFKKNGNVYEVISPDGNIGYTCRLQTFCNLNKLDRGAISRVINYQVRQHNGWIVSKIS
jgi:hypothetical protein